MAARRAGKGGQFRRIPSTAGCLGVGTTIAMDVAGPVMNRLPLQRTLVEWTLSATALATVVAAIVGIDERTRAFVAGAVAAPVSSGRHVRVPHGVSRVARTAWDLCVDHQPLALFAVAASVLVVFMVRTK